ncbi:MAG: hypothetical protein JWL91_2727 [Sphingomonas bacterium]|nr:hypothetical protein [Sphingomonas bacterium]MDB5690851.1 hypothetical protein [Sphingomonas bacterium]
MTDKHKDTPANDAANHDAAGGKLHDAAGSVRDAAAAARNAAGDTLASAREKVGDVLETAKDKSSAAYVAAADKTGEAVEAARLKAAQARRATSEGIEENPLAALIGGIAVGVLVGALLPRTKREEDALRPIASKLTDVARTAATAARDAGKQSLDEMGINREAARGQVDKLVDTAVKAASSASTAAADAVRNP